MARINIEIPNEVHKRIRVACALQEKTLIEFVHEAMKVKLDRNDGQEDSDEE